MTELLRARCPDYRSIEVPEIVEVDEARRVIGSDLQDVPKEFIHFVDSGKFLRYDTTLPLLIAAKNIGAPARLAATGQVYRNQTPSPTRNQSFHQLELLVLDAADALNSW